MISIIIISYNRVHDMIDLLVDITQLNHTEILKDVIVLNNASTDDYSMVEDLVNKNKNKIRFKYINAPENLGVSRGRNLATKFAEGDILFYIDDDTSMKDKEVLPKIIHSFSDVNGIRKVGVVSFKVCYASNMQMQTNAFPHKKFDKYKDRHEFLTYYYAGCAHAKLKQAWSGAGEYPEDFFYGMEEYDFSFRVLDKGYCIKYDDSVVILHKESPLGRITKSDKLRMMWVNKSKVAWKYLPKKYFYSIAIMWNLFFIKKTNFNWSNYAKGWRDIFRISKAEKRTSLKKETLKYLQETEARLWY